MSKKTPKHVQNLILRQQEKLDWIDEILRVKRTAPPENQANHVRDWTEQYWIGIADATNAFLEDVLHEYGCYHGFCHVAPAVKTADGVVCHDHVTRGHPDYAEWRKSYHWRV